MRRKGYTMRPKAKDTTPPITVLLTRQERWTRAQECHFQNYLARFPQR